MGAKHSDLNETNKVKYAFHRLVQSRKEIYPLCDMGPVAIIMDYFSLLFASISPNAGQSGDTTMSNFSKDKIISDIDFILNELSVACKTVGFENGLLSEIDCLMNQASQVDITMVELFQITEKKKKEIFKKSNLLKVLEQLGYLNSVNSTPEQELVCERVAEILFGWCNNISTNKAVKNKILYHVINAYHPIKKYHQSGAPVSLSIQPCCSDPEFWLQILRLDAKFPDGRFHMYARSMIRIWTANGVLPMIVTALCEEKVETPVSMTIYNFNDHNDKVYSMLVSLFRYFGTSFCSSVIMRLLNRVTDESSASEMGSGLRESYASMDARQRNKVLMTLVEWLLESLQEEVKEHFHNSKVKNKCQESSIFVIGELLTNLLLEDAENCQQLDLALVSEKKAFQEHVQDIRLDLSLPAETHNAMLKKTREDLIYMKNNVYLPNDNMEYSRCVDFLFFQLLTPLLTNIKQHLFSSISPLLASPAVLQWLSAYLPLALEIILLGTIRKHNYNDIASPLFQASLQHLSLRDTRLLFSSPIHKMKFLSLIQEIIWRTKAEELGLDHLQNYMVVGSHCPFRRLEQLALSSARVILNDYAILQARVFFLEEKEMGEEEFSRRVDEEVLLLGEKIFQENSTNFLPNWPFFSPMLGSNGVRIPRYAALMGDKGVLDCLGVTERGDHKDRSERGERSVRSRISVVMNATRNSSLAGSIKSIAEGIAAEAWRERRKKSIGEGSVAGKMDERVEKANVPEADSQETASMNYISLTGIKKRNENPLPIESSVKVSPSLRLSQNLQHPDLLHETANAITNLEDLRNDTKKQATREKKSPYKGEEEKNERNRLSEIPKAASRDSLSFTPRNREDSLTYIEKENMPVGNEWKKKAATSADEMKIDLRGGKEEKDTVVEKGEEKKGRLHTGAEVRKDESSKSVQPNRFFSLTKFLSTPSKNNETPTFHEEEDMTKKKQSTSFIPESNKSIANAFSVASGSPVRATSEDRIEYLPVSSSQRGETREKLIGRASKEEREERGGEERERESSNFSIRSSIGIKYNPKWGRARENTTNSPFRDSNASHYVRTEENRKNADHYLTRNHHDGAVLSDIPPIRTYNDSLVDMPYVSLSPRKSAHLSGSPSKKLSYSTNAPVPSTSKAGNLKWEERIANLEQLIHDQHKLFSTEIEKREEQLIQMKFEKYEMQQKLIIEAAKSANLELSLQKLSELLAEKTYQSTSSIFTSSKNNNFGLRSDDIKNDGKKLDITNNNEGNTLQINADFRNEKSQVLLETQRASYSQYIDTIMNNYHSASIAAVPVLPATPLLGAPFSPSLSPASQVRYPVPQVYNQSQLSPVDTLNGVAMHGGREERRTTFASPYLNPGAGDPSSLAPTAFTASYHPYSFDSSTFLKQHTLDCATRLFSANKGVTTHPYEWEAGSEFLKLSEGSSKPQDSRKGRDYLLLTDREKVLQSVDRVINKIEAMSEQLQ